MTIAVYRDPLRSSEISWSISVLAKLADKVPICIKDLDPVVHRVGHVDVSFAVDRHPLRRTEIPWRCQKMILPASSDPSQQFQRVRVIHNHLILLCVYDVQKSVRCIDSQPNWILQSFGDLIFYIVLRIKNQYTV